MDRIYESGAAAAPPTPPAIPSSGYPSRGNPAAGVMPTVPGPYMFHQLVEEIMAVIAAGNIAPDKLTLTQLKQALDAVYVKKNGTSPILQNFAGLTRSLTALGGGLVREYVDIPNAATVGGIEICTVYNCAIDPVTGVWAGRDIADICWLEKWHDTAGTKEIWIAPTAAANAVPAWVKPSSLNANTGTLSLLGDLLANSANFKISPSLGLSKNINGQDLNAFNTSGFYDGTGVVNSPMAGWMYFLVQAHSASVVGVSQYCKQTAFDFFSNRTFSRYCTAAGVWTAWTEILDIAASDNRYAAISYASKGINIAANTVFTAAQAMGQIYLVTINNAALTLPMPNNNGEITLVGNGTGGVISVPAGPPGVVLAYPDGTQVANGTIALGFRDVITLTSMNGTWFITFMTGNPIVKPATAANQAARYDQVPGLGQTRQNLTASRALGTVNINSTGREIKVTVATLNNNAGSNALYISIAGGPASIIGWSCNASGSYITAGHASVPVGASYVVTSAAAITSLVEWAETR